MISKKVSLNRSETVRLRWAQQSANRQRSIPPIVKRSSGMGYISTKQVARLRTGKRYGAVLDVPGVKIHMPAIPAIKFGWRFLSFFLSALLGWAIYSIWTSPTYQVTEANVYGNQRIDVNEINSVLGVIGKPVFLVIPEQVERTLQLTFHDMASISVKVSLPNRINVTVTERQPIIAWQQDGGLTWIDSEGVAFKPRGQVEGLIPVTAMAPPPEIQTSVDNPQVIPAFISTRLVTALQTIATQIPAGTPIHYEPQYGLGWKDDRGWIAYFGQNTEDMKLKLQIYQTMVDWLIQRDVHPSMISVAYPDAPFYRLEE